MSEYVAGIDIGTTGTRCTLFDEAGRARASAYRTYRLLHPRPGWAEQSVPELIAQTFAAVREAVDRSGVPPREIAGVACSSQRSAVAAVDRDGRCLTPLISWQDLRAAGLLERAVPAADHLHATALPPAPTWLSAKILWWRSQTPDLYARTWKFLQVQDLALQAFGADEVLTDLPDLAFTGVWDVRAGDWSRPMLERLGLGPERFGRPAAPGQRAGRVHTEAAAATGLRSGTPLFVGAGDQSCTALGLDAVAPGTGAVVLGTAGLVLLPTDRPEAPPGWFLTQHILPGRWQAEALLNLGAAAYRWLDGVLAGGREEFAQLDREAAGVPPGSRGLLFLPELAGGATPVWDADARGAFLGLTLAHGRAELARAVLEGVALAVRENLDAWRTSSPPVHLLSLGGGAARSEVWSRVQADVYQCPVRRPDEAEAGALGAAILAGLGAGWFATPAEGVTRMVRTRQRLEPDPGTAGVYTELAAVRHTATDALRPVFRRLGRLPVPADAGGNAE